MFLVKFTMSQQCTPDDWEMVCKEKLFDENTTLKEIQEWVKSKFDSEWNKIFDFIEVKVSKPETQ